MVSNSTTQNIFELSTDRNGLVVRILVGRDEGVSVSTYLKWRPGRDELQQPVKLEVVLNGWKALPITGDLE